MVEEKTVRRVWGGGGRAARDLRDVGWGPPGGPGIWFSGW